MAETQDILDQAAAETPQAPAPNPEQAAPSPPGGDLLDQAAGENQTNSGTVAAVANSAKSWWSTVNGKLDTPVGQYIVGTSSPTQNAAAEAMMNKIVEHEVASAHPYRAALAQFFGGSLVDASKFATSLTTPKNLALQAVGGLQGRAARMALTAANLYFAYRGGQEMLTDRQEGETLAEEVQRRLSGAAGAVLGTTGAAGSAAGVMEATRLRAQQKLGISGDLAQKVADKVIEVDKIRQQGVQQAAGETLKGAQAAGDILDQAAQEQGAAKVTLQSTQEIPVRMGQLVRDAAHAVYSENARVSKPFEEMAAQIKQPVSDAASVRATIVDTLKSHGVQDHEIPAKIFNALADRGITSDSGDTELQEIAKNLKPDDPRLAALQSTGALADASKPVSFKDMTRVRGDLYDAAQAATDNVLKNGLFDAYDGMTQMQEDHADSVGLGDKYRAAKNDYKNFKRELGSGLMSDFLKAEDFKQQAMSPRLARIMGGTSMEALRGLLKLAKVDVSPLDDLVAQQKSAQGTVKTSPGQAEKAATSVMKTATKAAAGQVKQAETSGRALGKNNAVIPGVNDLDLQGKTNVEIKRQAIERLANNAKQSGISNPMGLFMLIYGSIRLALGSPFGIYPAVRGGVGVGKTTGQKLLMSPAYQDWVIREAHVDPSKSGLINGLRKGLTALGRATTTMGKIPQKANDEE